MQFPATADSPWCLHRAGAKGHGPSDALPGTRLHLLPGKAGSSQDKPILTPEKENLGSFQSMLLTAQWEMQNHYISWAGRDPQGSSSSALETEVSSFKWKSCHKANFFHPSYEKIPQDLQQMKGMAGPASLPACFYPHDGEWNSSSGTGTAPAHCKDQFRSNHPLSITFSRLCSHQPHSTAHTFSHLTSFNIDFQSWN